MKTEDRRWNAKVTEDGVVLERYVVLKEADDVVLLKDFITGQRFFLPADVAAHLHKTKKAAVEAGARVLQRRIDKKRAELNDAEAAMMVFLTVNA